VAAGAGGVAFWEAIIMTTAPKNEAIERWETRDLLTVAGTLLALFIAMFSAMFFGLSNMT
jgi:hypothetical protein